MPTTAVAAVAAISEELRSEYEKTCRWIPITGTRLTHSQFMEAKDFGSREAISGQATVERCENAAETKRNTAHTRTRVI